MDSANDGFPGGKDPHRGGSVVPESLVRESARLFEQMPELGKSLIGDIGDELSQNVSKGTAGFASTAARTVARVVWRRVQSRRADRRFEKDWREAGTAVAREAAVRRLLHSNPKLRASVAEILRRRDYLIALEAHCQRLAFFELILPGVRIEDVFVDPLVRTDPNSPRGLQRAAKFLRGIFRSDAGRRSSENYLLYGGVGAGKTTLIQYLTAQRCREVLGSAKQIDSRSVVLPAYVRATDLDTKLSLSESLHAATQRALGLQLVTPLPADFFAHQRDAAARQWLVIIDGIDEIKPASARLNVISGVREIASHYGPYRFLLTCNDRTLTADLLGDGFKMVQVEQSSAADVATLIAKYRAALGYTESQRSLARGGALATIPRTPLYVAMAIIVGAALGHEDSGPVSLFREFVDIVLTKRGFTSRQRTALLALIGELAAAGAPIKITRTAIERAAELRIIESGSLVLQKPVLEHRLMDCGLLVQRGAGLDFAHSSLRAFFCARRFIEQNAALPLTWELINPLLNGWEFAEFVFEGWAAAKCGVNNIAGGLLSYGEAGLRLFSRLAAQDDRLPPALIEVAVAKWLRRIHEAGTGEIEGGVDNIARMACNYEVARQALREIAADYRYDKDAINAARHLHALAYTEQAHSALLRIIEWQQQDLEIAAAEALYQIGFRDEGQRHLLRLEDQLRRAGSRDELMQLPELVRALHGCNCQQRARSLLDRAAALECIDDLFMGAIAATYGDIGAADAVRPFVLSWWRRNADLCDPGDHPRSPEEMTEEFLAGITDMDIEELMSLPMGVDEAGVPHGELRELWVRLPAHLKGSSRAVEIARNACLDPQARIGALNYLESHDIDRYRQIALELLGDAAIGLADKQRLAAQLISDGCEQAVGDALTYFVTNSVPARVGEAKLLAIVGRHAQGVQHLRQAVRSALGTEGYAASCRALAEMGESGIALSCLRRVVLNYSVPVAAFEGVAAELLLTERAGEIKEMLWKLLSDAAQPVERWLAACRLLDQQNLSSAQRRRLKNHVRQTSRNRSIAAYIKRMALDLLDSMEFDGGYFSSDAGWPDDGPADEELSDEIDELVAPPPYGVVVAESGERLASIDERGEAGIDPQFAPELLDMATGARVTLLNRLEAVIRLDAVGAPAQARRIAVELLQMQGENPGIPVSLVCNFAAYFNGAGMPERALSLCETLLRRADLDIDQGVSIAAFLASCGFSVQARQHARSLMQVALERGDAGVGSSLALWNCACLLFKLGEQHESRSILQTVASSGERPLWQRLHACSALAQIGALSLGRSLLRKIAADRAWNLDERFEILNHCMALQLDDFARIQILQLLGDEHSGEFWRESAFGLLQRLGYGFRGCAMNAQTMQSASIARRLWLLQELRRLQMWNEVRALVRQILSDSEATPGDKIASLCGLEASPLQWFADNQARRIAGTALTNHERVQVAEFFTSLGEISTSRQVLRELCDGRRMGDADRLALVEALVAAGCDESAFEQLQQVECEGLDQPMQNRHAGLRSKWASHHR